MKPTLFMKRVRRHETLLPLALLIFFTLPITVGLAAKLLPKPTNEFGIFIFGAAYFGVLIAWVLNYYKLKGSKCSECGYVIAEPGLVWKFMLIYYFCPKCGNDNRVEAKAETGLD